MRVNCIIILCKGNTIISECSLSTFVSCSELVRTLKTRCNHRNGIAILPVYLSSSLKSSSCSTIFKSSLDCKRSKFLLRTVLSTAIKQFVLLTCDSCKHHRGSCESCKHCLSHSLFLPCKSIITIIKLIAFMLRRTKDALCGHCKYLHRRRTVNCRFFHNFFHVIKYSWLLHYLVI